MLFKARPSRASARRATQFDATLALETKRIRSGPSGGTSPSAAGAGSMERNSLNNGVPGLRDFPLVFKCGKLRRRVCVSAPESPCCVIGRAARVARFTRGTFHEDTSA